MSHFKRFPYFWCLTLVFALAGCAPASAPSSPTPEQVPVEPGGTATPPVPFDPDLANTEWRLISLDGEPPLPETNLTLDIGVDVFGGYAGCNFYGVEVLRAEQGELQLKDEIASTAQLCNEPEGIMDQESEYLALLGDAAAYRIEGDRLELRNSGGKDILVFESRPQADLDPADLVGTQWQLVELGDLPLLEGEPITLEFTAPGEVAGYAGCRNYTGTYLAEGDDIRFTSLSMLETECPLGEAYLLQEGAYTTALGDLASDYLLAEDRLQITLLDGRTLIFAPLE